ncbi:MAG: NUDIX hydrolase [Clostridia bacterium]|nr:NUDIX hydrolase [Clostridia bacterium]
MKLNEKRINSTTHYEGRIIKLCNDKVELPNGKQAYREYVLHPGGVCVAPVNHKGEVFLVKQFRYPYNEEILEIPAGKRDSKNEPPLDCGKRELKEELGLTAENYIFLGEFYPTPGYVDEVIYMYAAWGLTEGESSPDEDEFVEKHKMPISLLTEKILSGEIKDGKTQAAVLKTKILIDNGKIKL